MSSIWGWKETSSPFILDDGR